MGKHITLFGAGRSTASLIQYLSRACNSHNWKLNIVESQADFVAEFTKDDPCVTIQSFDVNDGVKRVEAIRKSDLVISMLPVRFHQMILEDCITYQKHAVTASYITPELEKLQAQAKQAGVMIMMEMGLDPGIDHMSALKMIDPIRDAGNEILLFESFTGGLVAPESDNNPWNYKFTWNPRNVVIAGQGGAAKFVQEGAYKYIPYHHLFRRTEFIDIEGYGRFEGYANRDSLKYREVYGMENIPTIYRGTLRRPGFSRAWDVFVKLGATDDSYIMEGSKDMTHREFINSFLAYNPHDSVELKLMHYLHIAQDDPIFEKFEWLGVFEETPIGLDKDGTPAQILQRILEKKWTLEEDDKDMIVMWHKVGWKTPSGEKKMQTSSMVVKGEDRTFTSMAKTVGLPVAIMVKKMMLGDLIIPGIHRPVNPEIYAPVLEELQEHGIQFKEREMEPQFYWKEPK
jgi:saccharopine dehydrogenase-like NADP-dependent oxidoreductase